MTYNPETTPFEYSFVVWPDEEYPRWNQHVFALFDLLKTRVVTVYTQTAFDNFRESLAEVGITLREIERVPHHEPVSIS